ncbi:hypothetical protein B566_EDAN017333 [Ephemera danica]|nr:hypothetical protein B566_EDAN017333 [Ephemera danica]
MHEGKALQKVLITLRFYATGSFHIVTGDLLRVSAASACRCVRIVSSATAQLKNHFIFMPDNDEMPQIAKEFRRLSRDNLVGVIGAIDCTHIKIKLPSFRVSGRFYNRKQYCSLNVQVGFKYNNFLHDPRIYENSLLKDSFDKGHFRGHLIEDGGYASTYKMLVPYRDPSTPQQIRYNNAQIKARNSVERLFGVLKARFPCLGQILRLKLSTSQAVILTCCVFHNLAMEHKQQHIRPFARVPRELNVLLLDSVGGMLLLLVLLHLSIIGVDGVSTAIEVLGWFVASMFEIACSASATYESG